MQGYFYGSYYSSIKMKGLNIFFIILFLASAVLQYNDPDPYIWIPLYIYGAFLCYQSIRKIYQPLLFVIGISICLLYATYLFFNETGVLAWIKEHDAENIAQSMKATKPWIEETREFFGLLILITALILNTVFLRRQQKLNNLKQKHNAFYNARKNL